MLSLTQQIILEANKKKVKNEADLFRVKRDIHKLNKASKFPTNISLLAAYNELIKLGKIKKNKSLRDLLITKKMRSLSGVSVITVSTKPYPCPGKCIYCPSEKNVPKSYLSNEPAMMRAILCDFDPALQIKARLKSLNDQGHEPDKVEIIVIGGTFSYLPKDYQENYIKECFDALNGNKSKTLKEAQKENENAEHRMIGLTLETRPDFITKDEVKWFRYLGATRVELGVQAIDDEILKMNSRGHGVKEIRTATKLLKEAGFKICYHIMPNLYGSDLKKDIGMVKELFENQDYRPDYLKIYPCMVMGGTKLYELWKKGEYISYTDKEIFELVKKIKKIIPYYVRIKRLIRDIPAQSINSGSKVSNLRQILENDKKENDWSCKCIRCREVKGEDVSGELKLFREDYDASEGREIFLSYENEERNQLYSLLRLRINSERKGNAIQDCLQEIENAALIREVHTYGLELGVGEKGEASQHKGLGKKLIKEAEKIAKEEFGLGEIAVISGVGVREYYRKLGYELEGTYMIKSF